MSSYLKHLHVFHAVCQDGSMKQAGARLGRVQSAVSRSVQEIERALGVELFERSARGTLLTAAGHLLLRRVEFAFAELATARDALAEMGGDPAGRLQNAPIFTLAVGQRRLDVLVAFATRNPIAAVAKLLGVSQPAVSMAMRELELGNGLALFDRTAAGSRLTPAGDLILVSVKRALAELRLAASELDAMKGLMKGRIIVGALPFGRAHVLPVAIARLLEKHPHLQIVTVEGPFEALTAGVQCGDIDFLLGALQPVEPSADLAHEELFSDRMVVIARAGHPLARAKKLGARDLIAASWILPREGTPTRRVLDAALAALSVPPPVAAAESSDLSIIRGLLLESDLITGASRHLFHHELTAGSLVTLPVDLPEALRPIGILRRAHDHISPGARLLIEEIRAVPRTLPGSTPSEQQQSSTTEARTREE
jgi:LysR family transcriptional regulator, regulator for genes of the gallate degradation pathway